MSDDNDERKLSVSVPIGAIASAAVLASAIASYIYMNRSGTSQTLPATEAVKAKGKGLRRKVGLTTVITLLENDASRKVVLAALRAMARRA